MVEIQVTNNKEQSINIKFNSKIAKYGQIFQVQKSDCHLEQCPMHEGTCQRLTLSLKRCILMNATTSLQNGGLILRKESLCWESKRTLQFNKLSKILRTVSYFSRIRPTFPLEQMLY